MQNTPIIIVHKGAQEYLKICLNQVHHTNPNSRIILLGDKSNKNIFDFVEWYDINNYFESASNVAKIYKHVSCNKFEFELGCIQRHFIIRDFIKKNNIESFFHLDSDVMVYTNFKEEAFFKNFENYDFSLSGYAAPHILWFKNTTVLDAFLNYIEAKYQEENFIENCKKDYDEQKQYTYLEWNTFNPISDMTWLWWFSHEGGFKALDNHLEFDNSTCNMNMEEAGFVHFGNILNVFFENNVPYGIRESDHKVIKLHLLHFQGPKKRFMKTFNTYENKEVPNYTLKDFKYIFPSLRMSALKKFIKGL